MSEAEEMTSKETTANTFDCEEVLLPESNTTNGDIGASDFLNEPDPMSEDILAGQQDENSAEEEEDKSIKSENNSNILPKKRKPTNAIDTTIPSTNITPDDTTAVTTAEETKAIDADESIKDPTPEDVNESASTSRAATAKVDNQVDENQCRVCTSKDDLITLFKLMDNRQTIAQMLMTICPTVSIAVKDFMPQFICNACLDNVMKALQLKTQCETTERELRKKLSRGKNKIRRPVGYVTIDATIDSDPPSDEEPNDDVEFKVSDDASVSPDDDSDESDFSGRKRASRSAGSRRGRRKTTTTTATITTTTAPKSKKTKYIKHESDNGGDSDCETSNDKGKKRKKSTNRESLILHKKSHTSDRSLLKCDICGKQFKMQGAYRTHLQKHQEESPPHSCEKCNKVYTSKAELKRHLAEDHNETGLLHSCKKCKRKFASTSRLDKHISRCPGYPVKHKRSEFEGHMVGQDLFKTVAPLTTTYWSDSFSD